MRLNLWSKGSYERIYVSDMPGTTGATYIYLQAGRVRLVADQLLESEEFCLGQLAGFVGETWPCAGKDLFEAARQRATEPRARAPRGSRAMQSSALAQSQSAATFGGMASGVDLNFRNIKNSEPVDIEVDHREPHGISTYLAEVENARVTTGHLALGDFRINGRILVERKVVGDFANSVQSGHLFDQAQRMSFEQDAIGVVIIEGDVFRAHTGMLASAVTGAITCLSMVQRMTVINTIDLRHTAYVLAKIAQHDRNGLGYDLPLHKDKPTELVNAQRYVLEALNGVSAGIADSLLEHFGSVRDVFAASESDLRAVKGIGPKTASRIIQVLTSPYKSSKRSD